MAGFARRVAPAAALGGLAVIIVGVADPAIGNWRANDDAAATEARASEVTASEDSTSSDATTTDSGSGTHTRNRGGASGSSTSDGTTTDSSDGGDTTAVTCTSGQSVTGDSVMTRWGPVQVAATVDNGAICEVHAIAWPDSDPRSSQINAYAIPYLDEVATASRGTQIDYVSGATYTSDAYAESLQSILDRL